MGTAPFPFFCCPAPKKREMVIVSGDAKESQAEEVEFKWLQGISSNNRAWVKNNIKGEDLAL